MKKKENKKKIKKNPLPGIERTHFQLDETGVYWFDPEGVKHRIVLAAICANGTRDLCIYWKGPARDDVRIGKIAEVAKEHILWIPKGDILSMKLEPSIGDRNSVYIPIENNAEIKNVIREIVRRCKNEKGSDYDMFGGDNYL